MSMPRNKPKGNCTEELRLIYDGQVRGSSTCNSIYSQNWDFSSFPLLCERTYYRMLLTKYNLNNWTPYCIFFHAMNEYLNAYLLHNFTYSYQYNNCEHIFANQYMPIPIFEYISGIGKVKTKSGLDVNFNLPIGGTPQEPLDATDDEAAMESGSFGSCTAETHNSYECYVSPYVTRKLIERTLYANTTTDPDRFGDWSPLPKGRYPENGVANKNLLGYKKPEKLDAGGVAVLKDLDFRNDKTALGRIAHSTKVLDMVSDVLYNLCYQIPITEFKLDRSSCERKNDSAGLIYLDYSKKLERPEESLAEYVDSLSSPESFDNYAANKAYYFGYKRKRNPGAVGPCYTVDGKVPEGWEETRNDNFDMIGIFRPKSGASKASLRNNLHIVNVPASQRYMDISDWISNIRMKNVKYN